MIETGIAYTPMKGELISGDSIVVKPFNNSVLVALIDGLGHGDEAAYSANIAATILKNNPNKSLFDLFNDCHKRLKKTRGVVMSAAIFDQTSGCVKWMGVGNVDGILISSDNNKKPQSLLLRGGIIGYDLPTLRESVIPLNIFDTLIFVSDGIKSSFYYDFQPLSTPQESADFILKEYNKATDDATVLVAKYIGDRGPDS